MRPIDILLCLLLWLSPIASSVLANDEERELLGVENRIVGGSNAVAGEFPFFVQGWKCAGTLLWDDIVISSGHCAGKLNFEEGNGKVLVGPHLNRKTKGGAQWRKIVQEVVHPQYNATDQNYDFLIAKLDSSVTGKKIKPIKMNRKRKKPTPGAKLTTIGFGDRFYGAKTEPKVLQKVTVESFSWEECTGNYRSVADDVTIFPETEFCAGSRAGGKDSCDGDSGSSIFQYTKKGPVLIGVTAWGINCGKKNSPGVYVRVSAVMGWIQDQICRLSSRPPAYCKRIIPQGDSYRVNVKYDYFPTATSWSLTEFETRKAILDYPAGRVTGELYLVNEYVDLDPRKRYLLSVRSSYDDGIEGGWVKISKVSKGVEKQTVLYIDDISQDLKYTLFSGPNDYRIDFYYGKNPYLVSWSLKDSSGNVVLEKTSNDFANYYLYSEIFELSPEKDYFLSITDESGESLTSGEIRIFSLGNGFDEEVLYIPGTDVGSGGEFRLRR